LPRLDSGECHKVVKSVLRGNWGDSGLIVVAGLSDWTMHWWGSLLIDVMGVGSVGISARTWCGLWTWCMLDCPVIYVHYATIQSDGASHLGGLWSLGVMTVEGLVV